MLHIEDVSVGNTVRVIPLGLRCKLSYNSNGILTEISLLDNDNTLSTKIVSRLQKFGTIPGRLVNARECTVYGVFTLDYDVHKLYRLGLEEYTLHELSESDLNYINFIAYDIKDSKVIYGTYQQATTLEMMGFRVCDNFVVYNDVNTTAKLNTIKTLSIYPFITGFNIMDNKSEPEFLELPTRYAKVENVHKQVNYSGYIEAVISLDDSTSIITSYTDIIKYNIQKRSIVIIDEQENKIVYCSDRTSLNKVSNQLYCETCGSLINCPSKGYVKCSNSNCMSVLYPVYKHLCEVFNLRLMSFDKYMSYVESKQLINLIDVFSLPEYENSKIYCSYADVLRAICPTYVVCSNDFFDIMYECAGSFDALYHYLDNPKEIKQDMAHALNSKDIDKFVAWVSEPSNLLTVKSFYDLDNIDIKEINYSIDVPLIMRSKTICLIGEFKHGNYGQVSSLLKSYGAKIVTKFDNTCNTVVVGGFVRDMSKYQIVNVARSYNVPVYTENEFFNMYKIDEDLLKEN